MEISKDLLLFNISKSSISEMKNLTFDGERSEFICYETESDTITYYSIIGAMHHFGYICNFPKIASTWELPYEGSSIKFIAESFELCEPKISTVTNSYSNLILTSLQIRKKNKRGAFISSSSFLYC